jgi:putative endopeptidase
MISQRPLPISTGKPDGKNVVTHPDSIIVSSPKFLRFVDSLLPVTPVDTWKVYLQWYVIKNAASYLSNDFVQRNFQFTKVLHGHKEIVPRWQRMSTLTMYTRRFIGTALCR